MDLPASLNKRPHDDGRSGPPGSRKCHGCKEMKPLEEFTKSQKRKGDLARCQNCTRAPPSGTPKATGPPPYKKPRPNNTCTCGRCKPEKRQNSFPKEVNPERPVCTTCTCYSVCKQCTKLKLNRAFPENVDPENPVCTSCILNKVCGQCSKKRGTKSFPKDTNLAANPVCTSCILDGAPIACSQCKEKKSKDQYSDTQWERPRFILRGKYRFSAMTKEELHNMIETEFHDKATCQACEKLNELERKIKRIRKEARDKEAMIRNKVLFYNIDHPIIQYSDTQPDKLAGTYDIIFHQGFCAGQAYESRTTKGTVTLMQDDQGVVSGHVEFLDELRITDCLCFQRDFELWEGSCEIVREGDTSTWRSNVKARLIDEEAVDFFHYEYETYPSSLQCVKERAALPWMKQEDPDENQNPEDTVSFQTLQEAEALVQAHEEGPDCHHSWLIRHKNLDAGVAKKIHGYVWNKPPPVFFLEPGDLILETEWSDDLRETGYLRETVMTKCVLRKRP